MDEELEKKIGKIVLSIFHGFLKVLSFYLGFIFVSGILWLIFAVPTLLVGTVCVGIEKLTGIDTRPFRVNQLLMPINGLSYVTEKIVMILFGFLLKTETGLFILVMTILIIGFLEYQKKPQT